MRGLLFFYKELQSLDRSFHEALQCVDYSFLWRIIFSEYCFFEIFQSLDCITNFIKTYNPWSTFSWRITIHRTLYVKNYFLWSALFIEDYFPWSAIFIENYIPLSTIFLKYFVSWSIFDKELMSMEHYYK